VVGLTGRAMIMVRNGDVHHVPAIVDVCCTDRPGHHDPDDDNDDRDILFNNRDPHKDCTYTSTHYMGSISRPINGTLLYYRPVALVGAEN
jgi:hypothetical protein